MPSSPNDERDASAANAAGVLLFLLALTACVCTGSSILWALAWGLLVFALLARRRSPSWTDVLGLCAGSVRTVSNILTIFVLIGMLTAAWRASGTLAQLIVWVLPLIDPATFVAWIFGISAGMSLLLGTSFGTASTVGVILMTLARVAGVDPSLAGGAVLSGIYVGDRCSPMSSSAALVCMLTRTDLYGNVHAMWRSSRIPMLATLLGYLLIAQLQPAGQADAASITTALGQTFHFSAMTSLPAVLIPILCGLKIEVKRVMLVSIACACLVCLVNEPCTPEALLGILWSGFAIDGVPLSGGGVASMLTAAGIVLLSAPYSALFKRARILDGIEAILQRMAARLGRGIPTLLWTTLASMFCCNQTLTVLMSDPPLRTLFADGFNRAMALENTAILIPVLIPWNIAGHVPCSVLGVGAGALPFALFPILMTLHHILIDIPLRDKNA